MSLVLGRFDCCGYFSTCTTQDLFITGARSFVVDLAFLLEGKRREHLPERLLGAGRMCYVDIPRVIAFQASPATNIDATRLAAVDDDEAAALGAVAAAAAATGGSGHDGSSSSKPSLTKRGVAPYLHSGAVPHGAAAYAAQLVRAHLAPPPAPLHADRSRTVCGLATWEANG